MTKKYRKYSPDAVDLQRREQIGSLLKEYRIDNLMSRDELAEEYAISRSLIERVEAGKNITLQTYFRICDILMADPVKIMDVIND